MFTTSNFTYTNIMRKIIAIVGLTTLLISCGKSDSQKAKKTEEVIKTENLTEIKAQRAIIHVEYEKYATQLKQLDLAISKLDTTKKNPLVSLYVVKDTLFRHAIEIQGNVDTKENIMVYPQFSGAIVSLQAKAGQKVTKGQVLATIEDGGLRSQLAQFEAQYNLAKTTFERQSRLWNQKIGSEIQYLQAKTTMESQQKAVAQLKSQLDKTQVKAPFTGVIDAVSTEIGQVVSPGMPLMRVVSLSDMYVTAEVPESYLSAIKIGTTVDVEVKTINKTYKGKIRQIGNFINPNNRSFGIEISVPNVDKLLRPNQVAVLKIEDYVNLKAILVPESILQENAKGEKLIYVAKTPLDKKNTTTVQKQIVELGKMSNGYIEVTKGLSSGNHIVKDGAKSMRQGLTVEVVK